MDTSVFNFLYNFSHHSAALDFAVVFFASYLQYLLVLFLLTFLFWPKKDTAKNRRMVSVALLSALVARVAVKPIILLAYHHPRPFVVMQSVHPLIEVSKSEYLASFPSGHVIFFFALAMGVYFYNKRLGLLFFLGALLMGIARIFVGVHWPSDILGGAVIGMATAWLIYKWISKLFFMSYETHYSKS